jgi:hypothetical protein
LEFEVRLNLIAKSCSWLLGALSHHPLILGSSPQQSHAFTVQLADDRFRPFQSLPDIASMAANATVG